MSGSNPPVGADSGTTPGAAAVSGSWDLVIATPIGRQRVVLELRDDAGTLTGAAVGDAERVPLVDVRLAGDRLTWSQSITKPMRLHLTFDVAVRGDTLQGTSKAGRLPRSKVSGTRRT